MKRGIPPSFSIRIGIGRAVRGGWSFDSGFREATSRRQEDSGCRKKLKFAHVHEKDAFGCMPDDSSTCKEENTVQKSGGPKTSEYAFFRKMKEGFPQRLQSNPSYLNKSQSENFGSDEGPEGYSTGFANSDKDADSSMLDEDVRPMNFHTFFSPTETIPEKHVTAADQGLSDVFAEGENLHQWMRNTSSHEANKLYSKIYRTEHMDKDDMVGANWNLKPLLFEADIHREPHHKPPEPLKIVDGQCWGYDSSSSWSSKSAKRNCLASSDWREPEEIGPIPPPYASDRIFFTLGSPVRESEEADFMLGNFGPILPNPKFECGSAFPVKEYGSDSFTGSGANMLLRDRKSSTSVLQWNFDSATKHERDFMTSPNTEPNHHDSRLLNFWHDDHHHQQQQRNGICDLGMDALHLTYDCSEEFFNRNSNRHGRDCDEAYWS